MRQGNGDRDSRRLNSAQTGSDVARNTAWNILGTGLPIILALVTVPVLINTIGSERFGVFTIAWVLLTYFGLFDLGLGQATVKFMAEAFEQERPVEGRALLWTTAALNGVLGLVGGGVLVVLAPLLVSRILNVPAEIQPEALSAFYLMACAVPLATLTASLRGILEARHRFGLLNTLQVPISALNYGAPLLALLVDNSLPWLVGALVLSRVVGVCAFSIAAIRQVESPFEGPFFRRELLRPLFSFGGWLTVTNVAGPLMVYADRFVIGALSSMTAVAYYATPYEAVTRLWILPQSLARTVFPIFSAEARVDQRTRLYSNAVKHLALILAPVVATLVVFAPDLLRLWVGQDFAENSTAVLQILAVGVLVNSLALIPYSLIVALGRPDVTAKFHLLELPIYLLLLGYGVLHFGVVGAAVAWTVRVSLDGLLLVSYVRATDRLAPQLVGSRVWQALILAPLLVFGGWLLEAVVADVVVKIEIWGAVLVAVLCVTWWKLLSPAEREKITGYGRRGGHVMRERDAIPRSGGSDR